VYALFNSQPEPNVISQVDHFPDSDRYLPHTNATFKQQYVFDSTYYKPGGPVFLYIGGETSVQSRFSNLQTGIIQILMNVGILSNYRLPLRLSSPGLVSQFWTEQVLICNFEFLGYQWIRHHIREPILRQKLANELQHHR
jgi:hypothetical protein